MVPRSSPRAIFPTVIHGPSALSKNMKSPVGRASVPAIAEVAARDGRPTNCNILATDH
jgi:hypothetical protein